MASIGCISLVLINLAFKDTDYKTVEDKTSRIIIESTKKSNIPMNKEDTSDEGTRVSIPAAEGKPKSPVEPLPVHDANAPIIISPLS
jgi:hypothetical protein